MPQLAKCKGSHELLHLYVFLGLWLGMLAILLVVGGRGVAEAEASGEIGLILLLPKPDQTFTYNTDTWAYSTPVRGRVTSQDPSLDLHTVTVEVSVEVDGRRLYQSTVTPDVNGDFEQWLTVDPYNATEFQFHEEACQECHFLSDFTLPVGGSIVRVQAIAPDGETAELTRYMQVDPSQTNRLDVQLVEESGEQMRTAGIPILASTVLYGRSRAFRGTTDRDGKATLSVETLHLRSVDYEVSVRPVVIDGVRYSSPSKTNVVLQPGEDGGARVTAIGTQGRVTGTARPGAELVMVDLETGESHHATSDGNYRFDNLPISTYLLCPAGHGMPVGGEAPSCQVVDLLQSAAQDCSIEVPSLPSEEMSGRIVAPDGSILPFASARIGEAGPIAPVHPLTGAFHLALAKGQPDFIELMAPGYYGRVIPAQAVDEQSVQLTPKVDLNTLPLEGADLHTPSNSSWISTSGQVQFVSGMAWGVRPVANWRRQALPYLWSRQ